jgi:hypothetical protein
VRISKTKTFTFPWFICTIFDKIRVMFDTVDVFGAISMRALGCTVAQATLIYLFVVTSKIMCNKILFGMFCQVLWDMVLLVSSPFGCC